MAKHTISTPKGTKRISMEDYKKIKALRRKGASCKYIASLYGLSHTTIHNYVTGKTLPYSKEELEAMGRV